MSELSVVVIVLSFIAFNLSGYFWYLSNKKNK